MQENNNKKTPKTPALGLELKALLRSVPLGTGSGDLVFTNYSYVWAVEKHY